MKAKLYLETTIPSYLVANASRDARMAADQQQTIEWWELHCGRFEVYISVVVETLKSGRQKVEKSRLKVY
jgi:hypothetical protein